MLALSSDVPKPTRAEIARLPPQWDAKTLRVFWQLMGWRHAKARTHPADIPRGDWHHVKRAAQRELGQTDGAEALIRGVDGYDSMRGPFPELRVIWNSGPPVDYLGMRKNGKRGGSPDRLGRKSRYRRNVSIPPGTEPADMTDAQLQHAKALLWQERRSHGYAMDPRSAAGQANAEDYREILDEIERRKRRKNGPRRRNGGWPIGTRVTYAESAITEGGIHRSWWGRRGTVVAPPALPYGFAGDRGTYVRWDGETTPSLTTDWHLMSARKNGRRR